MFPMMTKAFIVRKKNGILGMAQFPPKSQIAIHSVLRQKSIRNFLWSMFTKTWVHTMCFLRWVTRRCDRTKSKSLSLRTVFPQAKSEPNDDDSQYDATIAFDCDRRQT